MSKAIYVLGSGELSEHWRNVFVMPGAADFTITHMSTVSPSNDWLDSTKDYLTTNQSIALYNHLLIWSNARESFIVLQNSAVPTQPGMIILDLFRDAFTKTTELGSEIMLFGKYNDVCSKYKKQGTLESLSQNFNVYTPYSPEGAFAYFLTMTGAKNLLELIPRKLISIDLFFAYWIQRGLKALVVHPNVVDLNGEHVQCVPRNINPTMWVIFAILLALFIALIVVAYV